MHFFFAIIMYVFRTKEQTKCSATVVFGTCPSIILHGGDIGDTLVFNSFAGMTGFDVWNTVLWEFECNWLMIVAVDLFLLFFTCVYLLHPGKKSPNIIGRGLQTV